MEKKKKEIKNKKTKIKKQNYRTSEQDEMIKFVVVILVVLLSVGAIYLFTRAFITKDLFEDKTNETTENVQEGTVNYDVAIMGQILNRPYKQYYVLIYDSQGDYNSDMTSLIFNYSSKKEHKHLYTVDLNNNFNKDYYDPANVNLKATELKDIKVGDITLIKVKNGKIDKYIVDYAKMQKELGVEEK